MRNKSEQHLLFELKKLRRRFYLSQAIPVVSLAIALLLAAVLGSFFGENAAIVVFLILVFVSMAITAYFEGRYLVIRCPNCSAYFYRVIKWPIMGWVVFFFFSNCNKCGLSIHGKNTEKFSKST